MEVWLAQLIEWTQRCWPAAPYQASHVDNNVWLHTPRTGDGAIFSVALDVATLLGNIAIDACPSWHWGLDMSSATLRGPMLRSNRVVMITAPLRSKGFRALEDWEVLVVLRYQQQPDHFLFRGPLSTDAWATRLQDACSGRVVEFNQQS